MLTIAPFSHIVRSLATWLGILSNCSDFAKGCTTVHKKPTSTGGLFAFRLQLRLLPPFVGGRILWPILPPIILVVCSANISGENV